MIEKQPRYVVKMTTLSPEEENYVRLCLLLTGMSSRAVRAKFDLEFSPVCLSATLRKERGKLQNLFKKGVINQAQWNILYPRNGAADSKCFDITLMICLIRNLTAIDIGDCLPATMDVTPRADLSRIKYYRNYIDHLADNKIDSSLFKTMSTDLCNAVGRLGGSAMHQECYALMTKVLDQSNNEIMLEIRRAQSEIRRLSMSVHNLKVSYTGRQNTHLETTQEVQVVDNVPLKIRVQIQQKLHTWTESDETFVVTRAASYVLKCIQTNSFVIVTGSSGVGKTATVQHAALQMWKDGYDILPVTDACDIAQFYTPNQKILFVLDDFCGSYFLDHCDLEKWKTQLQKIKPMMEPTLTKVIVTCRFQVYKDVQFKTLSLFTSCVCHLMSGELCLLQTEKQSIADLYLKINAAIINQYIDRHEFFPLLCKLYSKNTGQDVVAFFKEPFSVYENELNMIRTNGVFIKYCVLALCVIFNNSIKEHWLTDEIDTDILIAIRNTCEACGLDTGTSRLLLRDELDSLLYTYTKKEMGTYHIVHDKLFDYLSYYFGNNMLTCLIRNCNSGFIRERFLFQKLTECDQFVILVPPEHYSLYIQRLIDDWWKCRVVDVFTNINMKSSDFRNMFLSHLDKLDISHQHELAHKVDVGDLNDTVLMQCCFTGATDFIHWCFSHTVDVNMFSLDGASPLFKACQKGNAEIVKILLQHKADISQCMKDGASPIFIACHEGHAEIVNILLTHKADINKSKNDGASPLFIACQEGNTQIVNILLTRNADINKCLNDGTSPLCIACWKGNTDIVNLLLAHKSDSNLCKQDGVSPLFLACQEGKTDILNILLTHKADINQCMNDGTSPLFIACWKGYTETVNILLMHKADINLCKNDGASPLYIACQEGNAEIVNILLGNKADINKCLNDGTSPLFIACWKGNAEIVNILLAHKADTNLCKNDGASPLFIACQEGNTEITYILLKHKEGIDKCNKK